MRLSFKPLNPCNVTPQKHAPPTCCTLTEPRSLSLRMDTHHHQQLHSRNLESLFLKSSGTGHISPLSLDQSGSFSQDRSRLDQSGSFSPDRLSDRWMEYQGIGNWEGMLDPLNHHLRGEIIRYGHFIEAAYKAFEFDPTSSAYATCKYRKNTLLEQAGYAKTGYRTTKHLRATSGIQLPRWTEKAPSWMGTQSSWIGYVAVCNDKNEIARLGRRDVVIAFRGTATCLEWMENLRATLTGIPDAASGGLGEPMVESGFLSLYTSGTNNMPSLQNQVREEIKRLLQSYGDEPLSLTITGHSLGAALATLAAYDIKTTFENTPLVTVVSFGGPRVGNRSFRRQLEKQGTKVLRIVNSDDLITKVPGFVIDNDDVAASATFLPSWIHRKVEDAQLAYADVGCELKLSSQNSPSTLSLSNVAACHDLKTYLDLVKHFQSSTCPFRATARRMMNKTKTVYA